MTATQTNRIGDVLVEKGLLSQEQLQSAMDKQKQLGGKQPLGEILVSMGLITERTRVMALGEQWGVEYIDLTEVIIPDDVSALISQELARRYKMVPLEVVGNQIKMAMKNPLDIFATDEIRLMTGKEVLPLIATEDDILLAINDNYKVAAQNLNNVLQTFQDEEVELDRKRPEDLAAEVDQAEAESAPIIQLANALISRAAIGFSGRRSP